MPDPKPIPCLDAALHYGANGLMVFPIRPNSKIPATPHGVKDASAIEAQIRRLWGGGSDYGVGIAGGGPGRLVVLDVDGDAGRVALAALQSRLGMLPSTRMARTPRGGEHYYFRFPATLDISRVKNSVAQLGDKLDVRASGGYVVAPPTPNYSWISEADTPIAELPLPWADRLLTLRPRNKYADSALHSALENIGAAPEGQRNDTLNREAFSLGQLVAGGALDEFVVVEALRGSAIAAGLSEHEARRTVESGIASGKRTPRTAPTAAVTPPAASITGAPPAEGDEWMRALRFDRRGSLSKDASNIPVLLQHAPQWRGTLAWSEFSDRVFWAKSPPDVGLAPPRAGEELADHHATYLQLALARLHGVCFPRQQIFDAIPFVAQQQPVHEPRAWLRSLRWDGEERLGTWLYVYLGAEHSEYADKTGTWWMISAVARIMRPGTQVDHMLVLGGPQGAGKSSAVRILAGEWYLGSLPDLRDKDSMQVLRGAWLVEIAELDALRGSAGTRVKDFLTQRVDVYRPSYGRTSVRRPRQCIFVGTTNEQHYLQDATGARRFWPVTITRVDRDRLERDREQLLAEAVARFDRGERWWPVAADAPAIEAEQEAQYAGDAWEPVIAEWCRATTEFTVADVLKDCLRIEAGHWDRPSQTRVGIILRRLGFVCKQVRRQGAKIRLFFNPDEVSQHVTT